MEKMCGLGIVRVPAGSLQVVTLSLSVNEEPRPGAKT